MTRLTLRIDFGDSRQLGPGKIRLLELVDTHGSITASAKMMDMSYRRAWLLIDDLNGMFETPLVETRPGGRGGGNARLTVLGRAIVQLYRAIEKDSFQASSTRIDELERRIRPGKKKSLSPAATANERRKRESIK
jgi:molybdate transport system regulatory protein